MSMIDLGRKSNIGMEASPTASNKNKISYPSLYLDDEDLPLEEDDVGQIITVQVKLKVKRVAKEFIDKDKGTKKTYSCSFDVMGIDFGKKPLDELEREEYERNPIKQRR